MKLNKLTLTLSLLIGSIIPNFGIDAADTLANLNLSTATYNKLQLSRLQITRSKPIIVAVIDDGFRLTHNSLHPHIYSNQNEIPHNLIDDDKNGFIDDVNGWDISDGDNNVGFPQNEANRFYHGTFVSSTITYILKQCLNNKVQNQVKILPIKVVSDNSSTMIIKDGYKGIEYATKMGADIICCAWSGGEPTTEERAIVTSAIAKGIIIVASAGNAYQKDVDYPASEPGALAVTALDSLLIKRKNANCGTRIDLALPGEKIKAAHAIADNAWYYAEGTSAAAGLTTGLATVLKALDNNATPQLIIEALKNTALPLDSINMRNCGLLGSGLPQLCNAATYLTHPKKRNDFFNNKRPQGTIYLNSIKSNWLITPDGSYSAYLLRAQSEKNNLSKETITILNNDSIMRQDKLHYFAQERRIEASNIKLVSNRLKRKNMKIHYKAIPIDSTLLYCSGTTHIKNDNGTITDNSANANYANNSTCTWLIEAPNRKQISIRFSKFDTEPKIDFVWIFDGFIALPENTIAKFSGHEIPPTVTSRTNKVMVWFVTNDKVTYKGWSLNFIGK